MRIRVLPEEPFFCSPLQTCNFRNATNSFNGSLTCLPT